MGIFRYKLKSEKVKKLKRGYSFQLSAASFQLSIKDLRE